MPNAISAGIWLNMPARMPSGFQSSFFSVGVAELPEHSIVYYLHVFEDGDGRILIPVDALKLVEAQANAPIYGQHDKVWTRLARELLSRRRGLRGDEPPPPPGLTGGRICLILASRDPIVVKEEWIQDSRAVLGEDGVDVHVVQGGHEIAISKGRHVARIAMEAWAAQEGSIQVEDGASFVAP